MYISRRQKQIESFLIPLDLTERIKGMIGWNTAKLLTPINQICKFKLESDKFKSGTINE